MSENAVSTVSSNSELMSVSEATRKVLGKNFDTSVADVVEAVKNMTGKAPSKALVYQIKAKMKNASSKKKLKSSKSKIKIKKISLKTNKAVDKESLKWVSTKNDSHLDQAIIKLSKIREYIHEFGSKESLIAWANLA